MLITHFNFKQNMMIHTRLVKRLANRAKEKQMYPEMMNAHEAKKKQKNNPNTVSMDV